MLINCLIIFSLALILQEKIDKNLETRISTLEDTVIYPGNQIQNVKTQMTTSCHADFKWICVPPLSYNQCNITWNQVCSHLQGIWHDTLIGPDLQQLHEEVNGITQAHLTTPGSAIADRI